MLPKARLAARLATRNFPQAFSKECSNSSKKYIHSFIQAASRNGSLHTGIPLATTFALGIATLITSHSVAHCDAKPTDSSPPIPEKRHPQVVQIPPVFPELLSKQNGDNGKFSANTSTREEQKELGARDQRKERYGHEYAVFAGSGHVELAEEIANELGIKVGDANVGKFADGETQIQILESVRGKDIYIVQPTCAPINDNLVELLLMISTFRRASAYKITAVIPYYGYARQDRIRPERKTIGAADVARMLEHAGVDRVITVDLHRGQIEGFFSTRTPVENLNSLPNGLTYFLDKELNDPVVVCPSVTGVFRAKKFRDLLMQDGMYASVAFIAPTDDQGIMDPDIGHHHRIAPGTSQVLVGDVNHSDVIIVDDMIDTASRVVIAAETVKAFGAQRVFAFCTHGLFSEPSMDLIDNCDAISEVIVCNTVPIHERRGSPVSKKIRQTSIAPLVAEAIRRIQKHTPLTRLTHSS